MEHSVSQSFNKSFTVLICPDLSISQHCETPFNPVEHCDLFSLTNSENPNHKGHKD